jgi:hypothetical protein
LASDCEPAVPPGEGTKALSGGKCATLVVSFSFQIAVNGRGQYSVDWYFEEEQ